MASWFGSYGFIRFGGSFHGLSPFDGLFVFGGGLLGVVMFERFILFDGVFLLDRVEEAP